MQTQPKTSQGHDKNNYFVNPICRDPQNGLTVHPDVFRPKCPKALTTLVPQGLPIQLFDMMLEQTRL